jgi:anaerobic selenocysteine-containing dehydrogenase
VKAVWIEQANPMTSNPNINLLARAMNKLDLIVVADLFLTDTARMADIILPATSMFEYYDLITGYGHSYIQLQQKLIEPPGECKHESEMYRLLGKKFGFNLGYLPENDLSTIEKIIISSNLNTDVDEIKEKPYLHSSYQEIAFGDLKFNTPTQKVEFFSQRMRDRWGKDPLPAYNEPVENKCTSPNIYIKYPLSLVSSHAHNKMNSQFSDISILKEEPFVILKAILTDKVTPGIVHTYFGWWDGVHQANINKLIGDYISDIGHGTAFQNCLVEIQKEK